MNLYAFFITSLIVILIPGTGVIYTISTGIMEGKKKSILAAIGCTAGIVPHLCVSIALSSLLMQMNNTILTVIRLAGALYLLYLGTGMIFSKSSPSFEQTDIRRGSAAIIRRGVLINLLNPKLTLFFFSFLPQYLNSDNGSYVLQSLLLGLAFMVLTLLVFIGYGVLAGTAKALFIGSPKRISILQKCFGAVFVGFAVKLALAS
jgi:threonine/homoserine/homoserine lactone efflux protein